MFAALGAAQQQDFSKVEIKAQKVGGSVYMLTGSGGNIGVSVGDDGIVVVDDQFLPLAEKIQAALKGIADKPVRFLLNTHVHGDHTGGNPFFGKFSTIVAHDNVRRRLLAPSNPAQQPMVKEGLPVITFNDGLTVHLNGEDIRATHLPPGHTDTDSMIVFTESGVVHMGDAFVNGSFPLIDFNSGGSVRGYLAAVEKAVSMIPADAKIIPGHGPLGNLDDLKKFGAMIRDCIAIAESNLKAGKTADDMKKAKILDKYAGVTSPDRFIDAMARELGQK